MRANAVAVGIATLLAAATVALAGHPPTQRFDEALSGWPIGGFELIDQNRRAFTSAGLRGRWTLLVVGGSGCGEPCSAALAALTGLYRRIAGTKALRTTQVLFVSLDATDTPADLRRLLTRYDARFIGLAGPAAELAGLADDLGITYDPHAGQESADSGVEQHTGSVWLVGPDAVIRTEFLPPFDVPLFTAAFLKIRLRG